KLLASARVTTVALFLALGVAAYAAGRRLFGFDAGLLALLLVVLSPTLRAHGRLVTTDVPGALALLAAVIAFASFSTKAPPLRAPAAIVFLAASVLTKGSWPLVLPALAAIAAVALVTRRLAPGAFAAFVAAAVPLVWLSVWACYGFRYSPFRVGEGTMFV